MRSSRSFASSTSTPIRQKVHHLIIWIGGAADKYKHLLFGPTKIMKSAMTSSQLNDPLSTDDFSPCVHEYYGADNAKNAKDMKDFEILEKRCDEFRNRSPFFSAITVIGHSWGGRLAVALAEVKKIDFLVTLDPVGKVNERGWPGNDLPAPNVKKWINVLAKGPILHKDASDLVAWLGRKWKNDPLKANAVHYYQNENHDEAYKLLHNSKAWSDLKGLVKNLKYYTLDSLDLDSENRR